MIPRQMAYSSPGDVAIAYREGRISWMRAVTILMTQFGWSQNNAEELLSETGQEEKPIDDEPLNGGGGDNGNGSGDTNGDDSTPPEVSPGDYSLVGIVAFLWLLSKVF